MIRKSKFKGEVYGMGMDKKERLNCTLQEKTDNVSKTEAEMTESLTP